MLSLPVNLNIRNKNVYSLHCRIFTVIKADRRFLFNLVKFKIYTHIDIIMSSKNISISNEAYNKLKNSKPKMKVSPMS